MPLRLVKIVIYTDAKQPWNYVANYQLDMSRYERTSNQLMDGFLCTNFRQVHFECCEGYTTVYRLTGCSGVLALRDILKTARSMGAGLFVEYVPKLTK